MNNGTSLLSPYTRGLKKPHFKEAGQKFQDLHIHYIVFFP